MPRSLYPLYRPIPVLLSSFLCSQGMCEARPLVDFDGSPYTMIQISRRGRLHVGPRYKARGLNDLAEPGNEIECDQVVWRAARQQHGAGSQAAAAAPTVAHWSRYTWRRGSVPLRWSVKIKNQGIGEAEIRIQSNNTFKGSRRQVLKSIAVVLWSLGWECTTPCLWSWSSFLLWPLDRYVRRLQKRYNPDPFLDPDPDAASGGNAGAPSKASSLDASLRVPLVFVSLLRKGTLEKDRSETKLASAFDAVRVTLSHWRLAPPSCVNSSMAT